MMTAEAAGFLRGHKDLENATSSVEATRTYTEVKTYPLEPREAIDINKVNDRDEVIEDIKDLSCAEGKHVEGDTSNLSFKKDNIGSTEHPIQAGYAVKKLSEDDDGSIHGDGASAESEEYLVPIRRSDVSRDSPRNEFPSGTIIDEVTKKESEMDHGHSNVDNKSCTDSEDYLIPYSGHDRSDSPKEAQSDTNSASVNENPGGDKLSPDTTQDAVSAEEGSNTHVDKDNSSSDPEICLGEEARPKGHFHLYDDIVKSMWDQISDGSDSS